MSIREHEDLDILHCINYFRLKDKLVFSGLVFIMCILQDELAYVEVIFNKYIIVLMPHSSASNHSRLVYTQMPIKYIRTVKLSIKAISNTEEEDGGWKNG